MENNEQNVFDANTDSQESESKPKISKKSLAIVAGSVIVGGVALGLLVTSLAAPTKLEAAVQSCLLGSNSSVSLDEDGKGLYLDGKGKESQGIRVEDTVCVLSALKVPGSVTSRMSNTTALMGQQTADWDDITAMWTYHPNNGIDISLELK